MLQRLSSLFFGGTKDVSAEPVELKHRVLEADDGDWLLVSLLDGAGSPEASPAEALLAESPEESISVSSQPSLEDSMYRTLRVPEAAPPGGQSGAAVRVPRGVPCQARALTKVTQMGRVQRAQMRIERGGLGRSRLRRQNCALERAARRGSRVRGGFLQQPCRRSLCH